MNTLIEKWKPMLEYKFKNGLSVPEDKYQECAEALERTEIRYKDTNKLNDLVSFCIHCFAHGEKYGGGYVELLNDHPEIKEQLRVGG